MVKISILLVPDRQTPPAPTKRHRNVSAPPVHRSNSTKYDPFRARNFKKPVVSYSDDDSDVDVEHLLHHRVKRGVVVSDRPLSLESLTSLKKKLALKEDLRQRMLFLEAERVPKQLNQRVSLAN